MDKKKLAILTPAFPTKDSDSFMVPFVQQFLIAFIKNHPTIDLVIYTLYIPQGNSYQWNQIKVTPLNANNKKGIFKFISFIRSIYKLRQIVNKNEFQGILSFWYTQTAILGKCVSYLTSIKHYTWLQGQDVKKSNFYINYFRPKEDAIIALSSHQNKVLYKEFGIKAKFVNPIAINPSFFPSLKNNDREIDILGAGSFIALKNYQLFLQLIFELKKERPTIKVVLIGNGPLEKVLKDFVNKHNLEKNVTFPGLLSHKETLSYMNNSKIFLHTSNFEGGGMVLYESLYSGCQVVSTIPIEDITIDSFHYCKTETQLIQVLKEHLQKNKDTTTHRRICNDISNTTQLIYDLFF